MRGFRRYTRKTRCNCRVCLVSRYVKELYGSETCEIWLNEGFYREGQFVSGEITKDEYDKVYNKEWIKQEFGPK